MNDSFEPSPHRVPQDQIERQASQFKEAQQRGPSHGKSDLALVVNAGRQAVYASDAFAALVQEHQKGGNLYGKRPGELLACIHAEIGECGSQEHCRFCGTATAILSTQRSGKEAMDEWVVRSYVSGYPVTYNFKVSTIPFTIDGDQFVMLLFRDIADEKHRSALERIFFHDILNTVSGLKSYIDLLKRQSSTPEANELVASLDEIAGSLIDEIQSQKLLSSAKMVQFIV